MKTHAFFTALIIMATSVLFGFACGSASAPPVDLPAPITGRITVSDPDAGGYVTITGESGAVTGSSTVMAVNENVAGSVANIIDFMIESVWAGDTSFPTTCSESGHACALADADGAFSMMLAASNGDSIVFFLIDPTTGSRISEISSAKVVGAECSGLGLTSAAKDIALAPNTGTPLLLISGDNSKSNNIKVGTAETQQTAGCYASSVSVENDSTSGVPYVAMTSKDDKIIWFGSLSGNTLTGWHFSYSYEPVDIILTGDMDYAIVAMKMDDTVKFVKVASLEETDPVSASQTYPKDSSGNAITGITQNLKFDKVQMSSGDYLILALTSNADRSRTYVTLFTAGEMTHLKTWDVANDADLALEGFSAFYDVALWVEGVDHNVKVANVGLNTSGQPELAVLLLYFIDDGSNLTLSSTIDPARSIGLSGLPNTITSFTPKNIVVSSSIYLNEAQVRDSTPTALVSDSNGYLRGYAPNWLSPTDPYVGEQVSIAPSHDIIAVSVDDLSRSIYSADATDTAAVSVSQSQFNWR